MPCQVACIAGYKKSVISGITVDTLIQPECGGGVETRMNIASAAFKVATVKANMPIASNVAATKPSFRPKAYLGQNQGHAFAKPTTAVTEMQSRTADGAQVGDGFIIAS